jgi:hypothetical protein
VQLRWQNPGNCGYWILFLRLSAVISEFCASSSDETRIRTRMMMSCIPDQVEERISDSRRWRKRFLD